MIQVYEIKIIMFEFPRTLKSLLKYIFCFIKKNTLNIKELFQKVQTTCQE